MDALSELLRVIRLCGTAFIDADLTAHWAVQTPPPSAIAARLAPGATKIIPYHLVTEGSCHVESNWSAPIQLAAGQVVLFPQGDVHVLTSTPGATPMQITTEVVVKLTRPDSIAKVRYGGDGAPTRLICGFFACDEMLSERVVSRLPRVMHCPVGADGIAHLFSQALRTEGNGTTQIGLGAILGKLSELLFIDAIRTYAQLHPTQADDGLAGFRDRHVNRALALIFSRPDEAWTVEALANDVGTSKTVLTEHFARCMGVAPMQYLSQWRMRVAADSLRQTDRAIKLVAESAGFGSTAAFTRAFRREFGLSPARWRHGQRSAPQSGRS